MAIADLNLITDVVQEAARPIKTRVGDYDPLLELIGEARFCLLGEATPGTHEFYRERNAIGLESGEPPETFPTGM
jgi:erythromycin esterase-like protein